MSTSVYLFIIFWSLNPFNLFACEIYYGILRICVGCITYMMLCTQISQFVFRHLIFQNKKMKLVSRAHVQHHCTNLAWKKKLFAETSTIISEPETSSTACMQWTNTQVEDENRGCQSRHDEDIGLEVEIFNDHRTRIHKSCICVSLVFGRAGWAL